MKYIKYFVFYEINEGEIWVNFILRLNRSLNTN